MRKVDIPKLDFSPWYRWENRNRIPLGNCPGVYLISISKKDLQDVLPSFSDVVYIGMTLGKKGLKERWRKLDRCIRGVKGYHSGGMRIFEDKGHYEKWVGKLYVSAMVIECNVREPTSEDYIRMGWVAFLESDGFAKFSTEIGGHPKYQTR